MRQARGTTQAHLMQQADAGAAPQTAVCQTRMQSPTCLPACSSHPPPQHVGVCGGGLAGGRGLAAGQGRCTATITHAVERLRPCHLTDMKPRADARLSPQHLEAACQICGEPHDPQAPGRMQLLRQVVSRVLPQTAAGAGRRSPRGHAMRASLPASRRRMRSCRGSPACRIRHTWVVATIFRSEAERARE